MFQNVDEFLHSLSNQDSDHRKIDCIFNFFDDCFLAGEFKLPDEILEEVSKDVSLFTTTELVGFLTISWSAQDAGELENFNQLYDNIKKHFESQFDEKRVTGLLGGLEPNAKRQFKGLLSKWIYDPE